jgi:hypothetical protein
VNAYVADLRHGLHVAGLVRTRDLRLEAGEVDLVSLFVDRVRIGSEQFDDRAGFRLVLRNARGQVGAGLLVCLEERELRTELDAHVGHGHAQGDTSTSAMLPLRGAAGEAQRFATASRPSSRVTIGQ